MAVSTERWKSLWDFLGPWLAGLADHYIRRWLERKGGKAGESTGGAGKEAR